VDGVFNGLPEKGWAVTPLDLAENDFGLASAASRRPQRSFVAKTLDLAAAPQLSRLGEASPARGLPRTGLQGSELGREPEGLGAIVAGEIRLQLPGREEHLGDAAQFDRILTGVDGAGAGFERELAGKGEAVHGASKSQ
jgi:hypothetical protein